MKIVMQRPSNTASEAEPICGDRISAFWLLAPKVPVIRPTDELENN